MLLSCKYTNGQSLERHNWGSKPIKLKNIPTDIHSKNFNEELLKALDCDENEKAIIELLWGDVQLGKRVQACIIMWISVYVLQRPVIYIFRNLDIDRSQLQDDIQGTDDFSFNIQHIRKIVTEFNDLLKEHLDTDCNEYWHKLKLPALKDLRISDNINRLSNKDSVGPLDIFAGLMNNTTLENIDVKLSEYIAHNNELADFTLLIDEGDLVTPTASNDNTNKKDCADSTQYEQLLATISKKVRYSLKITGTAHSLLYNFTTRLGHNNYIQNKISKVHKMERTEDYYGIMNSKINFNTKSIKTWWNYQEPNPDTTAKKKNITVKYTLKKDYEHNIKNMIQTILDRQNILYNSLLISEEKIRNFQFDLVYNHILKDFSHLFLIVFHGKCLQLYLHKSYIKEFHQISKRDSQKFKRLYQEGGIFSNFYNTYEDHSGNNITLPNDYYYYIIDSKKFNIKMVYKLLKMLFTESQVHIKNKTAITITGKYGERGYSFTSDDYGKYLFHLTDQYLVSHAAFNCTDIAQRIRLQGKYKDKELKNGSMVLTLWTTNELKDVIQNFYVKFIKELEQYIMNCSSFEEIQELIENILDNGEMKFGKYMKYLDVAKKRKNIKLNKHFDKKYNGYRLLTYNDMSDSDIEKWCNESKLPEYICINNILKSNKNEIIPKYGKWEYTFDEILEIFNNKAEYLKYITQQKLHKSLANDSDKQGMFYKTSIAKDKRVYSFDECKSEIENIKEGSNLGISYQGDGEKIDSIKTRLYRCYTDINDHTTIKYILRVCKVLKKSRLLPDNINNSPFILMDDMNILHSELKEEYIDTKPENYYWKTPDGWLFLHMDSKQDIISLNITSPDSDTSSVTSSEPDSNIIQFTTDCCTTPTSTQLRFGIADIYTIYKTWCKNKNKKHLNRALFKDEFERLNYKEDKHKGVDNNGKSGKRGYNVMVELK